MGDFFRRFGIVGFLLLVVSFFIVLAILIPGGVRDLGVGQVHACRSNLKNLSTALEMFRDEQKTLPSSIDSLCPEFLKSIPECPASGRANYRYDILGEEFTVTCAGSYHESYYHRKDRPSLNSASGFLPPTPDLTPWG